MIQDLIDRSMFHFTSSALSHFTFDNRVILSFSSACYDLGSRDATEQIASGNDIPHPDSFALGASFSEFRSRARLSEQLRQATQRGG